jgi:hypothetical protein
MRPMNLKNFIYLLLPIFTGCFITNTPGFYSGYKKLDAESKKSIIFPPDDMNICNLENDNKIYAITANRLLDCLKKSDSSIVYRWSPDCKSKACISLSAAQNYCDKINYKLFLVTEYYDLEKTFNQNTTTLPMFSVNHTYYKTDYCNKYMRLFTDELIKNKLLSQEEVSGRFYVFQNDKLIKIKVDLFANKS